MDVADSCSLPGCYLLVVVGEPYSEDHKKQILQKISKGLLSWDTKTTGCDLSELENVCNNVKHGSDTENELLIQHSTETLAVEVLINPQVSTLKQCLKNLLLARTGHKHLIYAGYSFTGTGSWILQNGTFKFSNFIDAFQDADVQKELQSYQGGTFHVHCTEEGEWISSNFQKQTAIQKLIKLTLNPADVVDSLPGMPALIQCLDSALVSHTLEEIMTLSPLVGNIRFNRPTLYVFPGGEGDCALFGINGFNMLVDGGFNRKPCFWEFIRHLDRLDAVMVTRLCESNVCGITTLMKRKAINNIYPQIGYVFCNVMEGKQTSNDEITKDKNDLLVSVLNEGHTFLNNLMELSMKPHRCLRDATNMDPFTLYQKVGHGTLEMYTLSPQKDSKEVKEFLQQWASRKETFSRVKAGVKIQEQETSIPLSHVLSICSLVVWRPANPKDTITRIFFSGSAPQNRIFEGLEKLKDLDVLKKPVCSYSSLHPTTVEKPKSKLLSKGPLIKTSPLVTNGTGRSTESLGSKKETTTTDTESKKESIEKRTSRTPIKKDTPKSVTETKERKELRKSATTTITTTTAKKEIKEKRPPIKPIETKKTSPTPRVPEAKTKGLKEVTNKKTVETKTAKKKPELPKQKSPPTSETHKPKPISKPPTSTKTTPKPAKDTIKHAAKTEAKKIISRAAASTSVKKEKETTEKKVTPKEQKLNETNKLEEKEKPAKVDISDEKPVATIPPPSADVQNKEKEEDKIEKLPSPVEKIPSPSKKEVIELHQKLEETQKEEVENKITEESNILDNDKITEESNILDNDKITEETTMIEKQSKTDMLLANASMEGSFCEGLMEVEETVKEENIIQHESTILETSPYNEEKIPVEEVIEEKSEKESLHDVMALENNEEYEVIEEVKHTEYETEKKTVTVNHETPLEDNDSVSEKEIPMNKNNLSVDVESYRQTDVDDHDTIKSPIPMAVVDYEDEGVALEAEREKCEEDLPENDKGLKDKAFESYQGNYQDDVLEMDKSEDKEEKESLSFSEEEKLEEEEEMIRHPTPPGERNFYEKIGAIPDDRMEELDSRFMEHYLPRQGGDAYQPLYEEGDDDEESDSEGPIVEQPVYGNVIQADYPEFVNISGGTTPSEPQSPKAMHDSKHRFSDSEQLFKDTPPQEIDEDRFEEEQKVNLNYTASPTKRPEERETMEEMFCKLTDTNGGETAVAEDSSLQDDSIQIVAQEDVCRGDAIFESEIPHEEIIEKSTQDKELMSEKAMHELIQEQAMHEELIEEKAMQEEFIQEKTTKEEFIQESVLKEQDMLEDMQDETDSYKEEERLSRLQDQMDSFKEKERLSPYQDQVDSIKEQDRLSPLDQADSFKEQDRLSLLEQADSFKEQDRLSPLDQADSFKKKDRFSSVDQADSFKEQDRLSPLDQADSFKEQDRLSPLDQADSFKEQDRLSPLDQADSFKEQGRLSPLDQADSFKEQDRLSPLDQTDSFKEQERLSPCNDSFKDRVSPLQEYHGKNLQELIQKEADLYKEEEESLSPRRNIYDDHGSPLPEYDRDVQESMQEQTSFKGQESLSPCRDMYNDRESPLREDEKSHLPESLQGYSDSFKEQESLPPCRDIYKDDGNTLQERDDIFTYHDQKLEDDVKGSLGSDMKIEESAFHDKNIYSDKEKMFLEQDEPATRDIYSSESTMEYQEKQIYSEIPKPEDKLDLDNKLDSEEQLKSFQHDSQETSGHYDVTSSSMFNSHPMDQSFHESYADTDRKEDEEFYVDEKSEKLRDPYDPYVIEDQQSRFTPDGKEEYEENIPNPNINGKFYEEKHESSTSHYFSQSEETRFGNFENYSKDSRREFTEVTEEGYYGDNERSNVDSDHPNNITRYSFQTTESSDGDTVITERKEFAYTTTTNGISLSSDINGHKMESWKDNSLLGFQTDSFRNEEHDSASFYKRDYQDSYGNDNHTVPSSSDLFKSEVGQRHYSETTSINDIYLDSKDSKEIVEKETFSSMSFGYMKNDYHPEDKDDLLETQYSEHVQKDSKDFRLEDWSKPMGLPSPPETKTKTSSTRVSLSKSKVEKSSTSSTENVKIKMSSRTDKSSKMKTNTSSSVTPVYVDLAYVPHHGDPHYSNYEFFMRIRARYYVFSGINPSKEVLNSLLEAKKSWKDNSEVTIIPTYETDTLGYWMALNQETLIENKIDVAPSASRCTVNLQDHETSCAAYRLEF